MNQRKNNKPNRPNNAPRSKPVAPARSVSRGAAIRAQKRSQEDAHRIASQYSAATLQQPKLEKRANHIDDSPRLKIIGLGGMDGGGSKNTMLVEYMNDAIVLDCGND